MNDHTMTCERLEALLPDHFDGTLGEIERAAVERHAASCLRCGPLVADVEGIVADARALPTLRPSRDLWAGVEARIATPVVALGARPSALGARPLSRGWLAAAAVLLVVATAGITFQVTRRMQGAAVVAQAPDTTRQAPDTPAVPPTQVATADAGPSTPVFDADAMPLGTTPAPKASPRAPRPRGTVGSTAPRRREPRRETAPGASGSAVLVANPAETIEAPYAAEMRELSRMVQQRSGDLDPATVAVLEHSLTVIDQAIARSREALRRDPASGFLQEQLNHALDKKVGLLRTATRIPIGT